MGTSAKYKSESTKGFFCAHQVPAPDAKTDAEDLETLREWPSLYNPAELFTKNGRSIDEILCRPPG